MALPSELETIDLLDPNPDILALFCHYNEVYFDNKLTACTVDWSTNRMTLCAGICKYSQGSCAIRLSEPLLKFRSSTELRETLLHEMIHAYLWLTYSNQDHDDHGPCFQKIMEAINSSQTFDHQRPEGGYHITIYHNFINEVDSYRQHHWKCKLCGDLIKRVQNRAPGHLDCFRKIARSTDCKNERCHWHVHQRQCGGEYEKIAEPEGYKDKRPKSRRLGKEKATESKLPADMKENEIASKKKKPAMDKIIEKDGDKEEDVPSRTHKTTSLEMYFSAKNKYDIEAPLFRTNVEVLGSMSEPYTHEDEIIGKGIKRMRQYKGNEMDDEDFTFSGNGQQTMPSSNRQQREYTVIIGWKGWYSNESEEDEKDMKALDNKRSQRRMFERACCQQEDEHVGFSTRLVSSSVEMIIDLTRDHEPDKCTLVCQGTDEEPSRPESGAFEDINHEAKQTSLVELEGQNAVKCLAMQPMAMNVVVRTTKGIGGDGPVIGRACGKRTRRVKRLRGDLRGPIDPSTKAGSLAICPICEKVLCGDIQDADFNTIFNQHIDACMS